MCITLPCVLECDRALFEGKLHIIGSMSAYDMDLNIYIYFFHIKQYNSSYVAYSFGTLYSKYM